MKFYSDDIAIVAYSAVLPFCDNEEQLFDQLLKGTVMLETLDDDEKGPLQTSHHTSSDRKAPDKSYSRKGAKFNLDLIRKWAAAQTLSLQTSSTIEVILHELFDRLEKKNPTLFQCKRTECILGMSTGEPDTIRISQRKLYAQLKERLDLSPDEKNRIEGFLEILGSQPQRSKHLPKDAYSSLLFTSLIERFDISGSCSFVDAACASSLAALLLAVRRLRDGSADLVISGGVDVGTSLLTLIAFSKLQIMTEGEMNPFDAAADGINQGEAAGVFALMRLDTARAAGYPVHGVIRNCDGSSDGALGGMVEPTEYGQTLAYERAYAGVPIQPLTYLECHGTGTGLGDQTELTSSSKFFHPLPPIGSVKANLGHTIAAAGAVSLVKALKIIEHRTIPRMPRFQKIRKGFSHQVPTENISLASDDQIRIGISSFGFGGANFHLVLDEYRGEVPERPRRGPRKAFQMVLCGASEIDLNYVNELFGSSRFKVPPLSLPYADPTVLGGILAIEKITNSFRMRLSQKQRESVGVISNSNSFLERIFDCYERICHLEILRRMDSAKAEKFLAQNPLPGLPITEDSFMWALNNLIAGRITKDFDLKGPNFNVACEHASLGLTLSYARSLLRSQPGAYFILKADEELSLDSFTLRRPLMKALFVSELDFAFEANLPILSKFEEIEHFRPSPLEAAHA